VPFQTYLFYDLETTGLNCTFDQMVQFAAIRTDAMLQPLERHRFDIRLRPDVIPSPRAILTHGLTPDQMKSGMVEHDAVKKIHQMVNEPGTISVGYNSLGFDDAFLRFAFFRNLLPPYTHQYSNGCRRMDLLPITALYWLYKPNSLHWPVRDKKASLRLDDLNRANNLAPGAAHDAMADTESTVALARQLAKETAMWDYACGYFEKKIDEDRTGKLPVAFKSRWGQHLWGLMLLLEFGFGSNLQAPVLYLGQSIPYKNQGLWLRLDLPELVGLTEDTLDEKSWVIRKKYGGQGLLLPPLERYLEKIDPERQTQIQTNLQWLQDHPNELEMIIDHFRRFRYPFVPDLDPDAALYEIGFPSRHDENLCWRFVRADPEEQLELTDRFQNKVYTELAQRLLLRNTWPLPLPLQPLFERWMKKVNPASSKEALKDYRGESRRTPAAARMEIEKLQSEKNVTISERSLLDSLSDYLDRRFGC